MEFVDGIRDYFTRKPQSRYDDEGYFDDEYEGEYGYEEDFEEEGREPLNFMNHFRKDRRERARSSYSREAGRNDDRYGYGYEYEEEESKSSAPARLILVKAKRFSEVRRIAENLNQNRSVIINFEDMPKGEAQRSMDFLSGTTFAHDGHIQKVTHGTFIYAVGSVDIIGRIEEIKDSESFFSY